MRFKVNVKYTKTCLKPIIINNVVKDQTHFGKKWNGSHQQLE